MELTKQALKVENSMSFPNNNAGLITPTALRTFNENMIDSTVNQEKYTIDSASFDTRINNVTGSVSVTTGSLLTTASFNDGTRDLTFTKGDGSTFAVNIPDSSGSVLPSGVVSGSSQINYPQISNIPSGIVSGSSQVSYTGLSNVPSGIVSGAAQITPLLPSGTVSGSVQVKNLLPAGTVSGSSQVSYIGLSNIPAGIVSGAAQVTPLLPSGTVSGSSQVVLEDTTYTDNGDKSFLQTDGAGNLSFQYVDTIWETFYAGETLPKGTPLYFSGSQGANPIARAADAADVNKMPVVLIAGENITAGSTYEGIVLGLIEGIDLTGYTAGQTVYVAEGGGWSTSLPSGSNSITQVLGIVTKGGNGGKGLVLNPGPAQLPGLQTGYTWVGNGNNRAIAVTSGSLSSYIFNQDNTFSGTQTFNNIAVNGTASIAYLESVTGSAKIIGDAFIVLNNDTPTERYAGIIVVDSGSANTTASFQFDGLTNDWFYEYTGSDPLNFGVALFGPDYATKGSPSYPTNNRIQKGDGGHHLLDSNISDDGSTVSINSNTQITGSLLVNGNAPLINSDLGSLNAFTASQEVLNATFATTGSNTFRGAQVISGSTSITGNLNITPPNAPNTFPAGGTAQFIIPFLSGSTFTFVKDQDNALFWSPAFNQLGVSSSAANSSITPGNFNATNSSGNSSLLTTTRISNLPTTGKFIGISGDPSLTNLVGVTTITNPAILLQSGGLDEFGQIQYYTPIQFQSSQSFSDGRVTITKPLVGLEGAEITGSIRISGNLTASLQEGYVLVGDSLGITQAIPTSSIQTQIPSGTISGSGQITALGFATTGSNTFNGDQIVNGNVKQTFNAPATDTQVDIAAVNGAVIDGQAYTNVFFGMQDYPGSGDQYKDAWVFDYFTDFTYTTGSEFIVSPKRIGGTMILSGSSGGVSRTGISQLRDLGGKTFLNQYANLINIGAVETITTDQILIGNGALTFLRLSSLKNEITGSTIVSGSVNVLGNFTSSLQQGYIFVGDGSGRTTTIATSSLSSVPFPYTGSAQVTGSLGITGSMSGFVNTLSVASSTASVNFSDGNMFVITLTGGATTHFTPSNIKAGQTINIQISQPSGASTGSVTFSPNVKFAGGNDYQVTATGSAIDLLTFVSLDGTNVLGTSIKNFL